MPDLDLEGVDLDAVMQAVVDDMGKAAMKHRARRYEPKPKPAEQKAEEPAPEQDAAMPTAGELEALLSGG